MPAVRLSDISWYAMTNDYPSRTTLAILLVAVSFVLPACTRTVVTGSFNRVPNTAVEYAYVIEQSDFSQYTTLMNGGLEIYYPENEKRPDPADILKVGGQVIDMKMTSGGSTIDASGRLRDVLAHGELTFLMEMSDSVSGQVLARAGDKSSDISGEQGDATWDDVRRAAEYWAGLFRDWLDNSLGNAG